MEEDNSKPYWICQECGYESHTRPMPSNREKFYLKVNEGIAPNCPKCKSERCFLPVGF